MKETNEAGWVATETLGGTRLRTDFKDVPNLLAEKDPVPAGALTTGAVFRLVTIDSRSTSITFGVDF